ncbi:MAG: sensor histidine kinase [Syntrophothermus sp.]
MPLKTTLPDRWWLRKLWPKRLWVRLAGVFLVVALGTITLGSLLINSALNRQFQEYVYKNEAVRNERIVQVLAEIYRADGSWDALRWQMPHMGMMTGVRLRVLDNSGELIYDSSAMGRRGGMGMMWGMGFRSPEEITGEGQRSVSVPIEVDGQRVGTALLTSLDRQGIWSRQDELFRRTINSSIVTAGIMAGLFAVLASFLVARRIVQPLQSMTEATRGMQAGDYSRRVEVSTDDEIGELGQAFNKMASHLQEVEFLRRKLTVDVAHELRTPLSTIRSYVEAFQDGVMPPDKEHLSAIQEEVIRLVRLVDDLQELSVTESKALNIKTAPADLREVAAVVAERLRPLFVEKGLELAVKLPEEPVSVRIDSGAMNRVLHNLLFNAYKYTESGGRVAVAVEITPATAPGGPRHDDPAPGGLMLEGAHGPGGGHRRAAGHHRGLRPAHGQSLEALEARLSVADTGIGIAPEALPHIFERFYRADESRARDTGGTGIGLTIARELVEAQGGRIEVESRPGQGSRFTVVLPVAGAGGEA